MAALMWLSVLLSTASASVNVAHRLDPAILERPLRANDPLVNLKWLWRDGARGPLFLMESPRRRECGVFLAPEDWSTVQPRELDTANWWIDVDMLTLIKELAAAGNRIIVQHRTPVGGFAATAGHDFTEALRRVFPKLSRRSLIGINGYSCLYTIHHEMVHHWDHESGLADEIMDHVNALFTDPPLTEDQFVTVLMCIYEGRAYHMQISSILLNQRAVEFDSSDDDDERTTVTRVDGPDYRRYLYVRHIINFNKRYARTFRMLPENIRSKVEHLLPEYIPNYPRDFTPTGYMNQARCEQNLVTDLLEGRSVLDRED